MALEEMKKKTTNVSVYFPWTLFAYWIQILSFIDQNGEDENGVEIAKKSQRFQVWTWCIQKFSKC